MAKNQLFAWGRQRQGQCGSPEITTDRTYPLEVEYFSMTPKLIAVGGERSVVVTGNIAFITYYILIFRR
jgi:hypothetical protein